MACSKLKTFQRPQWFIRFRDSELEINTDVVCELKTIRGHLVVVAIIGSLRLGKSWLLNRLAESSPGEGFEVCDGQSAVTQGIWILCRHHPTKDNCILVFLDTEGLHDPFKKDAINCDNRLFVVTLFLSNVLIYNVSKKLDDNDLQKLGFVSQTAEKLQKDEAKKIFPEFVLVIRDVTKLKLFGNIVSPDQYMAKILEDDGSGGSRLSSKAWIRETFKNKKCFILPAPLDIDELDEMGQLENPQLRQNFLEAVGKLREHLCSEADLKRVPSGAPCTVKVFCEGIPEVVKMVQSDCIPTIPSIHIRIAQEENQRVIEEARNSFTASLEDHKTDSLYSSFREKKSALRTNGLHQLENNLVPENEEQKNVIVQEFKDFAEEKSHSIAHMRCTEEAASVLDTVKQKVKDNRYSPPEGELQFDRDFKTAKKQYYKRLPPGMESEMKAVWKQKEKEMLPYQNLLRALDKEWCSKERSRKLEEEFKKMKIREKQIEETSLEQQRQVQHLNSAIQAARAKERELELQLARQEARSEAEDTKLFGTVLTGIANVGIEAIRAIATHSKN